MKKNIYDLNHISTNIAGKGEVIILDKGEVIDAESEAMLQALHSRSVGGLKHHLKILDERGSENFMSNFYVGYNHKSIGDCGTTTAFIEGVSMLAAKAIQDSPLYSGQEASTRYIDFSKQDFIDPTNSKKGREILEAQRDFYLSALEPTKEKLRNIHPQCEGEKDSVYQKAIDARAFDITRSLLPAGASTNLAWHTNLRQAADKMMFLRHHPLEEVRRISSSLEEALKIKHPNSFGHKKYEDTEKYQEEVSRDYFYHDSNSPLEPRLNFENLDMKEIKKYSALFWGRPQKTELPKFLGQAGTIGAEFQLDFGSFRDIQRHRAINQRMPLLTSELGFNEWYLENLPREINEKLPEHLEKINSGIEELSLSKEESQYFLPMGYNTSNKFTGDLPSTIYMVELRDSRFVHPTLQKVAHCIGNQITEKIGLPLHVDSEPNRFDVKRGQQDITLK